MKPMKMKSHLSALFLLFLLLVDQSLAAGILPSLTKSIFKQVRGSAIQYAWQKALDKIKQNFSPSQSQPNAPLKRIEGLSRIKTYLNNYGYLQSSGGPFNDNLDEETKSALTTYQQYFNLQVTGDLNNQTFKQISLLRCAVPDMKFSYGFTGGNASWPKAGNRWFHGRNLTYGFLPASDIPDNATKVFKDAFTRWAQASAGSMSLNLTETNYDEADMKVGFYIFDDRVREEVLGDSIIRLQLHSSLTTGEIRLNATKDWALPSENHTLSWENGVLDLESAAMHQIGHLLGLDHSSEEESVMYPYVLPSQQRKVELSDSDKENFRQHNTNGNSGDGGRLGVLLVTTLSLGFAYLLLLY